MCTRQRTKEKPATAENEKASHETTAPRLQYRQNGVGCGVWFDWAAADPDREGARERSAGTCWKEESSRGNSSENALLSVRGRAGVLGAVPPGGTTINADWESHN